MTDRSYSMTPEKNEHDPGFCRAAFIHIVAARPIHPYILTY
jgi:hypothetical protein